MVWDIFLLFRIITDSKQSTLFERTRAQNTTYSNALDIRFSGPGVQLHAYCPMQIYLLRSLGP
jgi:hypothetical protein